MTLQDTARSAAPRLLAGPALWPAQAHTPTVLGRQLVINRGEGSYVFTSDGRRLFDGTAGLWHVRENSAERVSPPGPLDHVTALTVDADGTRAGFDLELIRLVRQEVSIPVIASGGAGAVEHFAPADDAGADAVLAATVFHFGTLRIADVKRSLASAGHPVR